MLNALAYLHPQLGPERLRALAPSLTVAGAHAWLPHGRGLSHRSESERKRWLAHERPLTQDTCTTQTFSNSLATEGAGPLNASVTRDRVDDLEAAVSALVTKASLPACAVYLFDEPWLLGHAIGEHVSANLGAHYILLDDAWAWRVVPGTHGWAPHRGWYDRLDSRAPELLNVWVALTDASVDRSCIHVVPLNQDAQYTNTERHHFDVPTALEDIPHVALAASAGDVLVWSANVLHWGGPCDLQALGPRVSVSFTLARGSSPCDGVAPALAPPCPFEQRLDSFARQIVTYGIGQPDVSDAVILWAKARVMLNQFTKNMQHTQ